MGVLTQLQNQKLTFTTGSPLGRWLQGEINRLAAEPDVPTNAAQTDAVHAIAQSTQSSGNATLTFGIRDSAGDITNFTTGNVAYNLAGGGATDAVHTIPTDATDHTGGNFTLTVELSNGETFTTAAIDHDASAAAIESAIDTAATGVVTSWSNGHISVAAENTDLQDGYITLTFDGASVSGDPNHVLTVLTDSRTGGVSPDPTVVNSTAGVQSVLNNALLTAGYSYGDIVVAGTSVDHAAGLTFTYSGLDGNHDLMTLADVDGAGGAWGAITETTAGQTERPALGVLLAYGVITGTVGEQAASTDASAFTKGAPNIPAPVVKYLCRECAAEDDNNSTYHSVMKALFGSDDRQHLVETRVSADA